MNPLQRTSIGAVAVIGFVLLSSHCHLAFAQQEESPVEAEEFSFDLEAFEKSPWAFGGYVQADLGYARLNRDAALYRIGFLGEKEDAYRLQGGAEIQAGLTYQRGPFTAYALGSLHEEYDGEEWDNEALLYEGHASWQAGANARFTLGKTLLRWGKGYAWNPTNFVGRDKNPSDPDLALEGYWVGLADLVKSFSGPLKTIALTGVVLPASEDVNSEFGQEDHVNVAGKLYLLLYDTDIDLMALSEGSLSNRYGVTASRNLTTNFEVHGEAALVIDAHKQIVESDGSVTVDKRDAWNYLAGIRYLSSTDTTWIFEYYHNGNGYTEEEIRDFFDFIDAATDSQLVASQQTIAGYQRPNFMQNYLYLKISQKEPFGWLYVTPALFTIFNADDWSYNLIPEISYTGVENLELRARLSFLVGSDGTEYGDKVNNWKLEFRGRYFF